jgi:4-hydroxy-tetrahydrodipicolinate reductase
MPNPTQPITVSIMGGLGKMGQATVKAVLEAPDMTLTHVVARQHVGQDVGTVLWGKACGVPIVPTLQAAVPHAQVCVHFTHPSTVYTEAQTLVAMGISPVIGTTGLTNAEQTALHNQLMTAQLGGLLVPNFSIGAVLLMQFAQQAARHFNHAEIIEIHHNRKADAPSGTAIKTAQLMATQQTTPFGQDNTPDEVELMPGARGAKGAGDIRIHSVRLPGMVAHQEVMLTSPGQLLTLRHDSFDRACYMPGVLLAIRHAVNGPKGLTYGLETLL